MAQQKEGSSLEDPVSQYMTEECGSNYSIYPYITHVKRHVKNVPVDIHKAGHKK